jgi:hypothetical protein
MSTPELRCSYHRYGCICSHPSGVDSIVTPTQTCHTQQLHLHLNRSLIHSLMWMLHLMIPTRVASKALHLIRRRLLHTPHGDTVLVQVVPVQPSLRLGPR